MTGKKSVLDKFYTTPPVAKDCIVRMLQMIGSIKVTFIEPSAGSGAFSTQIDCLAFDIKPDHPSIKKQDFLKLKTKFKEPICVFGNPPFGERNNLTDAFIKKSISFPGSKFVAFILPAAYQKRSMQKVFPKDWNLISIDVIPDNSFTLEGQFYHVPTVFQVWEKNSVLPDLREQEVDLTNTDFEFVKKNQADWFIFGAAPKKIISISDVNSKNRGYFVKSKIDKNLLCAKLQAISWKSYASSSVSGGVAWFTKEELVKIYKLNWNLS